MGCTRHKWVKNGGFYKVVAFDDEETAFEDMDALSETEPDNEDTEGESPRSSSAESKSMESEGGITKSGSAQTLTMKNQEITACLRIAACLTYSACQSRTLPGRLRLWDVGHMHFTKRHLNVGLSRGTSCDLIDLRE